jgi:lipoprotein NlpD
VSARVCRRTLGAGLAAVGLLVLAHPGIARGASDGVPARAPLRVHGGERGDTLSALARRWGVSVASIVALNRLRGPGAILRIGQRLTIPERAPSAARGVSGPRQTAGAASGTRGAPGTYVLAVPDFQEATPLFVWPVEGPVTSPFGRRRSGWHPGIDIRAELGTPVLAAAAGVVILSGTEAGYGRVIKIEHDGGFVTVYAHNTENIAALGDRVAAGDPIATVGRTGRASAHHLHFEIRRNGRIYNPLYLLPLPPLIAGIEETESDEPDDG